MESYANEHSEQPDTGNIVIIAERSHSVHRLHSSAIIPEDLTSENRSRPDDSSSIGTPSLEQYKSAPEEDNIVTFTPLVSKGLSMKPQVQELQINGFSKYLSKLEIKPKQKSFVDENVGVIDSNSHSNISSSFRGISSINRTGVGEAIQATFSQQVLRQDV